MATLWARQTSFESKADAIDTGTEVVLNDVLPAAREAPGFKGLISLANRDTGRLMSFTLWESEEALDASATWASQIRSDALAKIGALGEPIVEKYEVTVWEV
jgi:heme-degrading monooxygenase HmoA